jgi:chromosome segregation ATPase
MSAPTPLLERLTQLDAEITEIRHKPREVQAEANHATSEAERIREELTEAYASGDKTAEAKLTRAKGKAEARAAEPWPERIAGAERAANRLRSQRDGWVNENVNALLTEVAPDAMAAAENIAATIAALETARKRWHAVEQRVLDLVKPTHISAQDVPGLEAFDQHVRDLRRGYSEIPPPLPRSMTAAPDLHAEARAAVAEALNDPRHQGEAT